MQGSGEVLVAVGEQWRLATRAGAVEPRGKGGDGARAWRGAQARSSSACPRWAAARWWWRWAAAGSSATCPRWTR